MVALTSVLACGGADAQADAPFWSAGFGTANSRVQIESGSGWARGPSESGYVIRGGFRLTENLAVDLAYLRADGFEQSVRVSEGGSCDPLLAWLAGGCHSDPPTTYEGQVHFDASALQASVVGIATFGSMWEVYGKGGIASYRLSGREELAARTGARLMREVGSRDRDIFIGLGVGATVTRSWHVRLEYQAFLVDEGFFHTHTEAFLDSWSLNADYRFGSRPDRPNIPRGAAQ
jgi:hypothetical protein